MAASNAIRDLQAAHGLTDATLLGVLLDYIDEFADHEHVVNYAEDRANPDFEEDDNEEEEDEEEDDEEEEDEEEDDEDDEEPNGPDESMDGDHETGLRDAGFGTDEDYGTGGAPHDNSYGDDLDLP